MTATYNIPAANLSTFLAAIARLVKRALKLGVDLPAFVVGPLLEEIKVIDALTGETKVKQWHEVTLTAEPVKLAGWTFLGTLDHTTEAGVVLRAVPGVSLDTKYRTAKPVCDHCGYERRRNETFIVQYAPDADGPEVRWTNTFPGATKQVGRNCLADFLGQDPHRAAKMAEYLTLLGEMAGEFEDEGFGGGGGTYATGLLDFLGWVAFSIRADGWVSRAKAKEWGKTSTADIADNSRFLYYKGTRDSRSGALLVPNPPSTVDEAMAESALDWARSLKDNGEELNDYLHNVSVVAAGEAVSGKNMGIAASIVASYQRELNLLSERKKAAVSEHFGTVGKREVFTLTVAGFHSFDSQYGVRTLVRFLDPAGNVAVWWTGEPSDDFERDKTVTVKATVKAHEVYKGAVKQTVLSRVSLEPTAEEWLVIKAEEKRLRLEARAAKAAALKASPAGDPLDDPRPVSEWFSN